MSLPLAEVDQKTTITIKNCVRKYNKAIFVAKDSTF